MSAVIKLPHILIWLIKFGGIIHSICKWTFHSTVASNEHQDISIHLPLDCLLSSLSRLISKNTSMLLIFWILWSPVQCPRNRPVIRKAFPRHDVKGQEYRAPIVRFVESKNVPVDEYISNVKNLIYIYMSQHTILFIENCFYFLHLSVDTVEV